MFIRACCALENPSCDSHCLKSVGKGCLEKAQLMENCFADWPVFGEEAAGSVLRCFQVRRVRQRGLYTEERRPRCAAPSGRKQHPLTVSTVSTQSRLYCIKLATREAKVSHFCLWLMQNCYPLTNCSSVVTPPSRAQDVSTTAVKHAHTDEVQQH